MNRDYLFPWTGVYLAEGDGMLITVIGSTGGNARSALYIDGERVTGVSYRRGVVQWESQAGNASNGFLRFDVDAKGRRSLVGTVWPEGQTIAAKGYFKAPEVRPGHEHPSQLVGSYTRSSEGETGHLDVFVADSPEWGRHIAVELDGQRLLGNATRAGRALIVGDQRFPLATSPVAGPAPGLWVPSGDRIGSLAGSYALRVVGPGRGRVERLVASEGSVQINGQKPGRSRFAHGRLTWADGPADRACGEVTLAIDPITLMPVLFGEIRNASGAAAKCYGMVPVDPARGCSRPEPDFGMTAEAWDALVALCARASHTGGLLLWHKWEKLHYTSAIMNSVLVDAAR